MGEKARKRPRWLAGVLIVPLWAAVAVGGYGAGYASVDQEEPIYARILYAVVESANWKSKTFVVDARELTPDKTLQARYVFTVNDKTNLEYHGAAQYPSSFREGYYVEVAWPGEYTEGNPRRLVNVKRVSKLDGPG